MESVLSIPDHMPSVARVVTKRESIRETLRTEITSGKMPHGTRLPSTQILAKHFSVSYMTAHLALDDLVRDGWLIRFRAKGTFVADRAAPAPSSSTSNGIGVLLPVQEDVLSSGFAEAAMEILDGASREAESCGEKLAVEHAPSFPSATETRPLIDRLLRYRGVVFIGNQYETIIRELGRRGCATAKVAGSKTIGPTVNYDRKAAVRLACEHWVQHGYRRIGFLGTVQGPFSSKFHLFGKFLEEYGLSLPPDLVEECPSLSEAAKAAQRFLDRHPLPEAVFVDNEHKAEALRTVASSRNLHIPDDFALLTYGVEIACTPPPPSMVVIPFREMAAKAVSLLQKQFQGQASLTEVRTVTASLSLHPSCGCRQARIFHKPQRLVQYPPEPQGVAT